MAARRVGAAAVGGMGLRRLVVRMGGSSPSDDSWQRATGGSKCGAVSAITIQKKTAMLDHPWSPPIPRPPRHLVVLAGIPSAEIYSRTSTTPSKRRPSSPGLVSRYLLTRRASIPPRLSSRCRFALYMSANNLPSGPLRSPRSPAGVSGWRLRRSLAVERRSTDGSLDVLSSSEAGAPEIHIVAFQPRTQGDRRLAAVFGAAAGASSSR